ncbi:hypothetical protein F5148DRAFT_539645 [Russula earlei]|uniref:Uncharacterized protein n=1 Tax=Russula earlei TaxID=71964 RepID=A0ACC0TW97_9AGAM|nr:hypothetical protein F5148DRAFT_539645 [Russula earlei]
MGSQVPALTRRRTRQRKNASMKLSCHFLGSTSTWATRLRQQKSGRERDKQNTVTRVGTAPTSSSHTPGDNVRHAVHLFFFFFSSFELIFRRKKKKREEREISHGHVSQLSSDNCHSTGRPLSLCPSRSQESSERREFRKQHLVRFTRPSMLSTWKHSLYIWVAPTRGVHHATPQKNIGGV